MNYLHIRKSGDGFTRLTQPYPTYHDAVRAGQDLGGAGNFFVETKYVPTREEQLLLPPAKRCGRLSASKATCKRISALDARVLRELNL